MLGVWAVPGIPEIVCGDDLARIIGDALADQNLEDGDIIAVTSKIVSKAEGRQVIAADREDAITAETVRVVASRAHAKGVTRIVENRLGMVLAAAGVDSSNTPEGTVLLLPVDPDASALGLAENLRDRFGLRLGVIISDTLGRPWRQGQTDVAIGAAGIRVLDDLRGGTDAGGRRLDVTVAATADEIAGAADLVKGKASGLPVAVLRGLAHIVTDLDEPGARAIVRPASEDMFRLGTAEAWDEGYRAGRRPGKDRAVPNLPSRDFDDTIAFYGGFGFEVDHRDAGWLILRRGPLQLEFFLFPDLVPHESSFMCSVRVDDVDDLYQQIRSAGVEEKSVGSPRLLPVSLQSWGQRAGFLVDPDGTQLHLIENSRQREPK